MNWGIGLKRLAIAASVAYWALGAAIVIEDANGAKEAAIMELGGPVTGVPWENYWSEFSIKVKDGRTLRVRAMDAASAKVTADTLAQRWPKHYVLQKQMQAAWRGFCGFAIFYAIAAASFFLLAWVARGFKNTASA